MNEDTVANLSKLKEAPMKNLDDVLSPSTSGKHDLITVDRHVDIAPITGIPEEHILTRLATISKPSKHAMQSGTSNTHHWKLEFETRERWENPLMGWSSTGDPLSNVELQFATKDEAIAYCEKHGYEYAVSPRTRKSTKNKKKNQATVFQWKATLAVAPKPFPPQKKKI
nr:EOG090X0DNW [Eurycercus lamellatus]